MDTLLTSTDHNTKLTLYFPEKHDENVTKCLEIAERRYAVVGEVVDVIVIAEYTGEADEAGISEWRQKIESLQTLASVSPTVLSADNDKDLQFRNCKNNGIVCQPVSSYKEDPLQKFWVETGGTRAPIRQWDPHACSRSSRGGSKRGCREDFSLWSEEEKWTSVNRMTLACLEQVCLDTVPSSSPECSISVALWLPLLESASSSSSNILESFLKYPPEVIMHQQLGKYIQQSVTRDISLVPVPCFTCKHISAAGRHFISLTVGNHQHSSLKLDSVRVYPNMRESLMPTMSEASSISDATSFDSESLENQELMKISKSGKNDLPAILCPLEVMTFTFTIHVNEHMEGNDQGQSIYLLAIVTWTKPDIEDHIVTHYKLPSLLVRKPSLVITAVPEDNTRTQDKVKVRFTVVNNLQDFSSLKLVWSPERALQENRARESETYRRSIQNVMKSVVCSDPSVELGACKSGTVITAVLGFDILKPGLYELGQHVKLKLQYQCPAMPGHQRRGSITSTHSMPAEPRRDVHPTVTTRSASMCPLSEQETGGRRGSVTSTRSFTPSWTPTESSPAHTPAPLHRNNSHGNLTTNNTFKPHHNRVPSYGSYIVTPNSRPSSAMSSPSRPTAAISSSQVLKRNCQVYYQPS